VAKEALEVGRQALPPFSHRFSPKKFTQPQLFAIAAVRKFLGLDYRGMQVRLAEWRELRDVLQLQRVPNYSTLCYAEQRLLKKSPPASCSTPASNAASNAAC
jgi:hypothetical protein